jgi:hypothetical protein
MTDRVLTTAQAELTERNLPMYYSTSISPALREALDAAESALGAAPCWERAMVDAAAREASLYQQPELLAHVVERAWDAPWWADLREGWDRTESGCCKGARRAVAAEAQRLELAPDADLTPVDRSLLAPAGRLNA